ncbi:MAG: tripartite tricarboxylate transporter TctB family protein [Pseudomonadota bacterium]
MNVDRILGIGAILLAIPVIVVSRGYGVGNPKSPGAGFWPLVVAIAMVGLGMFLIQSPTPSAVKGTGQSRWSKFGISLGSLAFYMLTLEPLGYLLATVVLLFVQLRWVESRSWRLSILISVLTAVISLVLFRILLKVSLPLGLIPLPKGW